MVLGFTPNWEAISLTDGILDPGGKVPSMIFSEMLSAICKKMLLLLLKSNSNLPFFKFIIGNG